MTSRRVKGHALREDHGCTCQCGQQPGTASTSRELRAWHRRHKGDVLARQAVSVLTGDPSLVSHVLTPHSPQWHRLRAQGIGGSDVGAALGLSPWESPFSLWHRKAGTIGQPETSEAMRWGTLLEPLILDEYARRHPECTLDREPSVWVRDRWRIISPDAIAWDTGTLVEAKTSRFADQDEWGRDGTDQVPPQYRAQVVWGMDILGLREAHLAALIGGNEYREYRITYDPDEATVIREGAEMLWRSVLAGEQPDVDAMGATYEALRTLHPDIDGSDADVDPHIGEAYLTAATALKDAEATFTYHRNRLLEQMGTARRALVVGAPVARRQPGGRGTVALHPIHPKRKKAAA